MNNTSSLIVELFKTMTAEKIICAYHGDFNYKVINGLLINAKSDLIKADVNRQVAKKTYKVLVECLENIHKHAIILENTNKNVSNEGIFILSKDDSGYHITVGNLINNDEEWSLKQNFDEVNGMNKEELKQKYREIITNTQISQKGGAGLGIVDMALKAESHLSYTFHEYSNNLKFLTLDIEIKH